MTVGVVTTSFPRWPGDFAGGFVEDAVRAICAGGFPVEVLAAGTATRSDAACAAGPLEANGADRVSVFRVPVSTAPAGRRLFYDVGAPETLEQGGAVAWVQSFFFWTGMCRLIRERARAGAWTRIEAHWLVPCALAARAAAPHLRLTAHAHSGDVALLERLPGGDALARKLADECAELLFVSDDLRRRFARLVGRIVGRVAERAVLAPPRAPPRQEQQAARAAARAALGLQHPAVLSVGRLVPIKGFDVLVRAAALAGAHASARPLTIVVLGEGPERERLQDRARRLNVDLRLPGLVPRGEVPRWMDAANLYVQPSLQLASGRTEGLPTATLEAIAAGLPVVASATGGLTELPGVTTVAPGDARQLSIRLAEHFAF